MYLRDALKSYILPERPTSSYPNMDGEKKRILSFLGYGLPFQVLLLLVSGRVLSTKRSIIFHPFLAPTWVDDFPNFPFGGIWMFPKIMVPPNHPLKNRVFHSFHHPFWGVLPLFLVQHPYVFVAGKYISMENRIPIPEMLHDSRPPQQWRVLELETAMLPWEEKFQLDTACECLCWSKNELKTK